MIQESNATTIGVQGHVNAFILKPRVEIIARCRAIMDDWEAKGWHKPNDVPENNTKQEFRDLLRALGQEVTF